jgi:hypothetical protein
VLVRCDKAGGQLCRFAPGDPVANFDLIANRFKKAPLEEQDPFTGETFSYGYPELIGDMLGALYYSDGASFIEEILSDLIVITEPPAQRSDAGSRAAAQRKMAVRGLAKAAATLKTRAVA